MEAWSHHTGPGAERAHHRRPQGSSPTFQQRPQSTALPYDIVIQSFNRPASAARTNTRDLSRADLPVVGTADPRAL